MIEVAGMHGVEIKVVDNAQEQDVKELLKEYFELQEKIEELKKKQEQIKSQLKELGVGVGEPTKVEVDGVGVVKVSEKHQVRETLDKKKAKELLPESLYVQIRKVQEVTLYEIRKVKR